MGGWVGWFGFNEDNMYTCIRTDYMVFVTMMMMDVWINGLTTTEYRFLYIQYPLSEKMLKPHSNPKYYENLLKELDEAPKRSWFQSRLNKWKGFLRFS